MSAAAGLVVVGLLVGLDNLQVGAGLGLVPMTRRRRLACAVAFALCEGLMPLVGLVAGHAARRAAGGGPEAAETIGTVVLAVCGALLVLTAWRPERLGALAHGRWVVVVLPLSLSFDNLLAGAGLGAHGFPLVLSAVVLGTLSGTLALAGLALGARGRPHLERLLPGSPQAWSGAVLLGLAFVRVL